MLASPNSLIHARTDLTGSPVNRLMSVSLIGWPFKSKRPSGWTKQSRSTQNPRAAALHVRKERFPSHRDGESLKVFLIISHPSGNHLFSCLIHLHKFPPSTLRPKFELCTLRLHSRIAMPNTGERNRLIRMLLIFP